jgi:hypothetical protein
LSAQEGVLKVTISGFTAEHNGADGVYLGPGVQADITHLISRCNGGNGITVDQAELVLRNAEASGNGHAGIYVTGEDRAQIEEAIMAKPASEQPAFRRLAEAVFSGTLGGMTVEVLKQCLGIN